MIIQTILQTLQDFIQYLLFMFERLTWISILDISLVTLIFFSILLLVRDTQAMVLLRGAVLLVALAGVLTSLDVLPAFQWLMNNSLPAIIFAIPVIFAPEIRRGLERIGRTGQLMAGAGNTSGTMEVIDTLVSAASRLSRRKHGALIVLQRLDNLQEYINTGVKVEARVTPELLLQIFYPNTPLHDGAVIMAGNRVLAASCVMPLSSSGSLDHSPERQMGLRHRAALGIAEETDAISLVVSEETGAISIAQGGRLIRHLDVVRLMNILQNFYEPYEPSNRFMRLLLRIFPGLAQRSAEE